MHVLWSGEHGSAAQELEGWGKAVIPLKKGSWQRLCSAGTDASSLWREIHNPSHFLPSKTTLGSIPVFPGRYLDTTEKAAEDSPLSLRRDRAYMPTDNHLFVPITLPAVPMMRLTVDFLPFAAPQLWAAAKAAGVSAGLLMLQMGCDAQRCLTVKSQFPSPRCSSQISWL